MHSAIVFDDAPEPLAPLTDLRPACLVRTGALTTLERAAANLAGAAEVRALWTREPLAELTRELTDLPVNDAGAAPEGEPLLLVNGRCVLLPEAARTLAPGCALLDEEGAVVAALLPRAEAERFLRTLEQPAGTERAIVDAPMLRAPWDVIRRRDGALAHDLGLLLARPTQETPEGVVAIGEESIRISPDALVYPGVVLDAEHGPIVIEDGAVVRPGAVIIGPACIGAGSTVLDRALVKGGSAIGPVCKVAGEVGGTIFQGFANKAHDGHLGDSWIGEWVNLGAGTTNSNLLNTYGEVVAQAAPNGPRRRTGMRFLGCVIGDHVKTAILTRIMTGSVFGTGSMIAASDPPGAVGRFEWITNERRQPYRFEKFAEAARAAMARRGAVLSAPAEARLAALASPGAGP